MKGADYNQLWIHRLMLSDLIRGDAYRKGIENVVTPDSVVLDMGAGTGIMSFFAAAAGARKVYAVERTGIANIARELAGQNQFLDRIEIIQSDILEVQLPEPVDVLVSEWLGPFGVDENLLYPLLVTRDRWLKKGGKMIPETVRAWIAPAYDPVLDSDMFFWQSRPYGFDLQRIATHSVNEIRYSQQHLNQEHLLAEAQPMWKTNLYTFEASHARLPFRSSLSFECTKDALLNCAVVWFDAEFPGGTRFACGPGAPRNHWGSTVCPLERAVEVQKSQQIRIDFACELDETPGRSFSNWSVRLDGSLLERHDTRDAIV
jgi:hypothetical protein